MRRSSLALTLAFALTACGSTRGGTTFTTDNDAAVDVDDVASDTTTAPDASPDASPDVALDAAVDTPAPRDKPVATDRPTTKDVPSTGDRPTPDDAAADAATDAGDDVAPVDAGGCAATPLGSRLGDAVATGFTMGMSAASSSCGGAEAPESVFVWTAPAAGDYVFDTVGSDYDTVLYLHDGACTGDEIDCNDDTEEVQSEVTVTLRAGQTVVIYVDGYGMHSGGFTLNIHAATAMDAGAPDDV